MFGFNVLIQTCVKVLQASRLTQPPEETDASPGRHAPFTYEIHIMNHADLQCRICMLTTGKLPVNRHPAIVGNRLPAKQPKKFNSLVVSDFD